MGSDANSQYNVTIIGTGLTESIAAAALAKAGLSVLQVDPNAYYGGNEASLALDELITWADSVNNGESSKFELTKSHGKKLEQSKLYSLSLAPSLLPSKGPLITAVINSGVSRYGGFRLLESIAMYSAGSLKSVPSSKEDIFRSKEISVIEKRHLMRFLNFAVGEFEDSKELEGNANKPFIDFIKEVFSLKDELANAITFAIAFCSTRHDTTLASLKRMRHYMQSAGRYGPSPFLIAPFGGLGELVQGFCRSCAVSGGTYILGHEIQKLGLEPQSESSANSKLHLYLKGIEGDLQTDYIVSSKEHILPHLRIDAGDLTPSLRHSQTKHAICIAIIDKPISFKRAFTTATESSLPSDEEAGNNKLDTALVIYPPGSLQSAQPETSVSVLIYGEHTESCPKGKHVLYFLTIVSPTEHRLDEEENEAECILRPYVSETLSMICDAPSQEPIFSMFYTHYCDSFSNDELHHPLGSESILFPPSLPRHFAENGDRAARNAEDIFWKVIDRLGLKGEVDSFWPALQQDSDDDW